MKKLKPCPFCGASACIAELKGGKFPRYSVCCSNSVCFASESSCFGKKCYSKHEAAEMWNKREERLQTEENGEGSGNNATV